MNLRTPSKQCFTVRSVAAVVEAVAFLRSVDAVPVSALEPQWRIAAAVLFVRVVWTVPYEVAPVSVIKLGL